ncbi:MAG TPA: FUSC family protein [Candidatus Sulfotelmatobacter sp.]|nr:FUSC family protein [Candidatus Sulfotelmatobacter sp.]
MWRTAPIWAWDRVIASDPGLTRLATAVRTTLSVALSVVVVGTLASAYHFSPSVTVLAAIVAMQTAIAVNDPHPRGTTLLVPIPGAIGAALGTLVAGHAVVGDVLFLIVLFTAVAIRARGPRWTAFGTIAMITYFLTLFFGATREELPQLIVTIVIAALLTYLVRFVLLPDRSDWLAQHTLDAFVARVRLVAGASLDLLAASDEERALQRLRRVVEQLNATALTIENRLRAGDSGDVEEVRIVFDAELAAENLAQAAIRLRRSGAPTSRALWLALRALRSSSPQRAARIAGRVDDDAGAGAEARELATAICDLVASVAQVRSTVERLAVTDQPWGAGAGAQQPALRQAVQITVASAASIAVGELLSPSRWFWAVLAAYFVFSGTASAGETLARAWQRTIGTAVGALAGILLAHLLRGNEMLDVAAVFVFLFCAMYTLRISQAVMIFFITADLALLYALLGSFSNQLLEIRLAETAIGALFGGLASTLIFPTRTADVIASSARDALEGAVGAVTATIDKLLDARSTEDPIDAAHELDDRIQRFVVRARSIVSAPAAVTGASHDLRRWMYSLAQYSYYARNVASLVDREPGLAQGRAAEALRELEPAMLANIAAAQAWLADHKDHATVDTAAQFDAIRRAQPDLTAEAHLLERLDRTMARLAREAGTLVR